MCYVLLFVDIEIYVCMSPAIQRDKYGGVFQWLGIWGGP